MARITIVTGLLLCGVTVIGLLGATSGLPLTAFIPMLFGIPLVILGIIGLNPHRRKMAMHIAVGLAALGGVMTAGRALASLMRGADGFGFATLLVSSMAVICLVYVGLGVRSFIQARRSRTME
jgi:hypothetical protein